MDLTDRSETSPQQEVLAPYTPAGTPNARGAASRTAILEAVRRVLGRDGLARCSLAAVAKEAGCSKARVLYHFGSRDGLFAALALETKQFFVETLWQSAVANFQPGPGAIEAALRAAMSELFREENLAFLRADRELSGLGQLDSAMGAELSNGVADLVEKMTVFGGSLGLELAEEEIRSRAFAMVMAIYGHIEHWLCSGGSEPDRFRESAIRAARAIATEGIEGI